MIIVGKSKTSERYDEIDLPYFKRRLRAAGRVAYAWSFNPRTWAMDKVKWDLDQHRPVWLYLICRDMPWSSRLKMHVVKVAVPYDASSPLPCPPEWIRYVPGSDGECYSHGYFEDWGPKPKPIHLWFLVDEIKEFDPPINLESRRPVFANRSPSYAKYGESYFAFLKGR